MSPGISEPIGIGCFVLCVSLLAIGANRIAEVKRKPVGWSFLVWWWLASTVGAGVGILIVLNERGWLSSPKGIPWVDRTGYEGVLVEWATAGAVAGLLQAGAIALRGRLLRGLLWAFSSVLSVARSNWSQTAKTAGQESISAAARFAKLSACM